MGLFFHLKQQLWCFGDFLSIFSQDTQKPSRSILVRLLITSRVIYPSFPRIHKISSASSMQQCPSARLEAHGLNPETPTRWS